MNITQHNNQNKTIVTHKRKGNKSYIYMKKNTTKRDAEKQSPQSSNPHEVQ